jgi:spermidine synthase
VIKAEECSGRTAGKALSRIGSAGGTPPFVLDDGQFLDLHFTMGYLQSRMSLLRPYELSLDYTRRMMAFLLFHSDPLHVELVGLGGGSLTKFCYRELPHAQLTTIEINHDVISLAPFFQIPETSPRVNLVHADASAYFVHSHERSDVILLDGCDTYGIAPKLVTERFYALVFDRLRPGGIAVANLVGGDRAIAAAQRAIAKVFNDRLLIMNVAGGSNLLAFAFRGPQWPPDWTAIMTAAPKLAQKYGLDLEGYAAVLERAYREGGTVQFNDAPVAPARSAQIPKCSQVDVALLSTSTDCGVDHQE